MKTVQELLRKLKQTQEEGDSLLDRIIFFFSSNLGNAAAVGLGVFALALLVSRLWSGPKSRVVVRLAGFSWTRADFYRGWPITGDTGSGKTRSGITPLLFQVAV